MSQPQAKGDEPRAARAIKPHTRYRAVGVKDDLRDDKQQSLARYETI